MAQASVKKLEHNGPAEKMGPQCHRDSSWQVRQSRLCQKEKEQSRLSKASHCMVGESQNKQELHCGE